jgi:hypothetical protein
MSQLRQALDDYLTTRRALGYALTRVGPRLSSFVAFADAAGIQTVTTECALAWAMLPTDARSAYLLHRLGEVRGFARYLRSIDPDTQIPPTGLLLGCRWCRAGETTRMVMLPIAPLSRPVRELSPRSMTVAGSGQAGQCPAGPTDPTKVPP